MLQSVTGYYRVLQSVTKCYRVLQSVAECYRVLQSVTKCYRVLQSINLAHLLGPIFGLVLCIVAFGKNHYILTNDNLVSNQLACYFSSWDKSNFGQK